MLTIEWLSPSGRPKGPARVLPGVSDLAMAIDLAEVLDDAGEGQGANGFAIADVSGTPLHVWRRGDPRAREMRAQAGRDAADKGAVPRLTAEPPSGALLSPHARRLVSDMLRRAVVRPDGAGRAPVPAAEQAPAPREQGPSQRMSFAATQGATTVTRLACAPSLTIVTRPSFTLPDVPWPQLRAGAIRFVGGAAHRLAALAMSVFISARHMLGTVVAGRRRRSDAPSRTQSNARAPSARPWRFRVRVDVDYFILGAAAAALILAGPPAFAIYRTVSQIAATGGDVLFAGIDTAHLRASLERRARARVAAAQIAESRSVASDQSRSYGVQSYGAKAWPGVRLVGPAAASVDTVRDHSVKDALSALAHGPAFATIMSRDRIDLRKLARHLRLAGTREIEVKLYDAGANGFRPTLVFRRSGALTWRLWDLRG